MDPISSLADHEKAFLRLRWHRADFGRHTDVPYQVIEDYLLYVREAYLHHVCYAPHILDYYIALYKLNKNSRDCEFLCEEIRDKNIVSNFSLLFMLVLIVVLIIFVFVAYFYGRSVGFDMANR